MRAVIYCRVSTTEQTKNLSLPTQERLCREYCKREGYEVARVFIELGESAKTTERPEFKQLLTYCGQNKGKLQALVVHSLSRFSRNSADHHAIRGLLAGYGIRLRSTTERLDETPMGRFMETVLAGVAQLDNDVKAARTVEGMKEAVSRGRWVWAAPIGYVSTRDRFAPSLRHDPQRAPLIRRAFELYASGKCQRNALLETLRGQGLTSRNGRPLGAQSLHNMLRNPIYVGRIRASRWATEHQGDFEPIVSESIFLQVQARLSRRGSNEPRRSLDDPDFPLRRFLRCGNCSTPLTGSRPRGRRKRYPYYHCRNGCHGIATRAHVVHERFAELLEGLQPRPEYMRLFRAVVLDCWKTQQTQALAVRRNAEKRVWELREKLRRVEDAYVLENRIDQRSYTDSRDRLREQLAYAELELTEARDEQLDVDGVLAFAEHLLMSAASLWTNAANEDKRALQRALFPEGLDWGPGGFGTAVTCRAFSQLRVIPSAENEMASPPGFEH